jgi:hypothetical protein
VGGEKRCLKNWYVNYILLFDLLWKNVLNSNGQQ